MTPPEKQKTPNEGYVYFGLRGAFDPEEITLQIGITPTSSCAQGAMHPELGLPKTSQWQVSTERIVAECIDVYEMADQIDFASTKTADAQIHPSLIQHTGLQ